MDKIRSKQSRIAAFSSGEKINLINTIKAEPLLWDFTDKKHFDLNFNKNAWEKVAAEMDRDVSSCKAAWKSLRDSYRYHCKSAKIKSGSAGTTMENPGVPEAVDWQFAPYMAFLPDLSSKRKTFSSNFTDEVTEAEEVVLGDFSTFLKTEDDSLIESEILLREDLSEANEDGKRLRVEEPAGTPTETPALKMLQMFGNFLDANSAPAQPRPVLAYWDYLFNKLPPEDVDDVEREITQLLWSKIPKSKQNARNDI